MENQYDNDSESGKLFDGMNRKNVFNTPGDYFEKLPLDIADRIHKGEPSPGWQKLVPVKFAVIVTCVTIAVLAGMFYMNSVRDQKTAYTVWSYDDLVGSGIQIDEVLILEAYEKASASEKNNQLKNNDTQHLKDYLIENNTDISLIINEL